MVKFLSPGTTVHIDQVPKVPVIFELIRKSSGASLAEMYKVFNMGVRMLLFVDKKSASTILDLCSAFDIAATIRGEVKRTTEEARVMIQTGDTVEPQVTY